MVAERGLTRSEYRARYQIQESSFAYHLQGGRIGVASVPGGKLESPEEKKRLRGVTYIDRAPLSYKEIIKSPKYDKNGIEYPDNKVISLQELGEKLGIGRLSKLSTLVHAFAQEEEVELVHYTCFAETPQTVFLVGLLRGFELPFMKWFESKSENKQQSRKNRSQGVVAYQEVTPEILANFYPYNVVAKVFKDDSEDLYRVSPTKLVTYLKDKTTKQQREDIEAIYFKGIPVVQWAELQGITKAAMYLRLERYTEQFSLDKELYMFSK